MPARPALPLVAPIALADPLDALRALATLPYPFLLHSSLGGERSRWSFFGADPFAVFQGDGYGNALDLVRRLSGAPGAETISEEAAATGAPLLGGVVGYWAYDFGRRLETLPSEAVDDLGLPDVLLGCYDVVGAFDHSTNRSWIFSSGQPLEGALRQEHASRRLDLTRWRLTARPGGAAPPKWRSSGHATSTFDPAGYRRTVETVKEHIRRGDIFQANLSQRWTLPVEPLTAANWPGALALGLFASLSQVSPAPFGAFFGAEDHAIASASPERFLELRGGRVEARPIKGTRPRGEDEASDRRLAEELLASAKDRAENVMIVDVLRNDLGRVCEAGSVETPRLCELESFAQVHHLTSTVTGRLESGLDALDLLHACFPGGSITGAPKIRAMEILDRLEPRRRHLYTGSLGYVDWRGDADWNIAIRTAIVTERAVHFAAGGGITADSDPEAEYRETLDKAEGMRAALSRVLGPVALEAGPLVAR